MRPADAWEPVAITSDCRRLGNQSSRSELRAYADGVRYIEVWTLVPDIADVVTRGSGDLDTEVLGDAAR
jgi:hypothetical protein